jgi:hypothetical protein
MFSQSEPLERLEISAIFTGFEWRSVEDPVPDLKGAPGMTSPSS